MPLCKYCGEEFSKRGIRLHQLHCKTKGQTTKEVQETEDPEPKKKGNIAICPSCKESDNVRPLNKKDSTEALIISKGFNFVCDKCEEVF